jgi:hypothetical protein
LSESGSVGGRAVDSIASVSSGRCNASANNRVGLCGADRHDGLVSVEAINIGPSEAIMPAESVSALAGKGLRGDRHFRGQGAKPGQALTLIEAEALADVGLTGAQSRRQVVVRGGRLNELVGRRFRVGEVECVGVELCEPCLHRNYSEVL